MRAVVVGCAVKARWWWAAVVVVVLGGGLNGGGVVTYLEVIVLCVVVVVVWGGGACLGRARTGDIVHPAPLVGRGEASAGPAALLLLRGATPDGTRADAWWQGGG